MSTTTTYDSETREVSDDDLLATLDEEQKAIVELQKIQEMTIRPGLMKLPVSRVSTSPNSEGYVIDLDHPFIPEKELKQHYRKPISWQHDHEFVRVLDWYTSTGTDPYALQTTEVYVEYDESDDDWRIVRPPDSTRSMREVVADRWRDLQRVRPRKSNVTMFAFMLTGVLFGGIATVLTSSALLTALLPMCAFLVTTILGMAVLEP